MNYLRPIAFLLIAIGVAVVARRAINEACTEELPDGVSLAPDLETLDITRPAGEETP